jgi:DNA-directed RNA polymerase specialized sigma24 family protein
VACRQRRFRHWGRRAGNPDFAAVAPATRGILLHRRRHHDRRQIKVVPLDRLARGVARLPDRQRQVVVLHLRQGLTSRDSAARLGRPEEAARKLFGRVAGLLRDRLGQGEGVPGGAGFAHGRASESISHGQRP